MKKEGHARVIDPIVVTFWRTFSRGRRSKYTWREFIDTIVAKPEVARSKKRVAGFSLGAFRENRRTLTRVEHVHALTLDFDRGDTTLRQATKIFRTAWSIGHTTYSSTPKHPKIRLVLPLSRPVDAGEYERLWLWAETKTGPKHKLDEAARDASRFWYLPSHPPGAAYEWIETKGGPIDVDATLAEAPLSPRPFPGPKKARSAPSRKGRVCVDAPADETFYGRAFIAAGMAFDLLESGALSVVCPWASAHTGGVDGDSSTVVLPPTTDGEWGLFHCSHAHCARRATPDLLDVLPARALETARREHGRGIVRVRVLDGWRQRLEALGDVPALERFILKCRPRDGAIFTMTVKEGSSLHVRYLQGLPLPLLIGRRLDVALEGRVIKAARLVRTYDWMSAAERRARGRALLASSAPDVALEGDDLDFVLAVVMRASAAPELVGVGVRRILVRESEAGRYFEVVRVDGSRANVGRNLGSHRKAS